jgi:hypothetical protein
VLVLGAILASKWAKVANFVLVNNMLKKAGSDAPASEPTWDALRLNLATLLDFEGNDQFK